MKPPIAIRFLFLPTFLLFMLMSKVGYAQFVYLEGGLSYHFTTYQMNFDAFTAHHQFQMNLTALHRPVRKFGFGVQLGIPFAQFDHFNLASSPTPDGSSFYNFRNFGSESGKRYVPDTYEYSFEAGITTSLLLRYFYGDSKNSFLQGRLSRTNIEESFRFERSAKPAVYSEFTNSLRFGSVSALQYSTASNRAIWYPGIGFGWMKNFKEQWLITTVVNADFMMFDDSGWEFQVEHDWDIVEDRHEIVDLQSQADGLKVSVSLCMAIAYYF